MSDISIINDHVFAGSDLGCCAECGRKGGFHQYFDFDSTDWKSVERLHKQEQD